MAAITMLLTLCVMAAGSCARDFLRLVLRTGRQLGGAARRKVRALRGDDVLAVARALKAPMSK